MHLPAKRWKSVKLSLSKSTSLAMKIGTVSSWMLVRDMF